jgi:hypothetical protein
VTRPSTAFTNLPLFEFRFLSWSRCSLSASANSSSFLISCWALSALLLTFLAANWTYQRWCRRLSKTGFAQTAFTFLKWRFNYFALRFGNSLFSIVSKCCRFENRGLRWFLCVYPMTVFQIGLAVKRARCWRVRRRLGLFRCWCSGYEMLVQFVGGVCLAHFEGCHIGLRCFGAGCWSTNSCTSAKDPRSFSSFCHISL